MNSSTKKKISKASTILQEVADYLEDKSAEDFELYGQRLFDLADEIETLLGEVDDNESNTDDEDDHQKDDI
ncbi:hypothetical protein [Desulfovibrio sp. TomC]|uniref:hypothetical protein n=1 Tax=Desulfovibrio sp. TomC TaxID=1562888 RepID=UPI0005BCA773|nr:hypothetical protein [Desulfovibrio sp. TomC]